MSLSCGGGDRGGEKLLEEWGLRSKYQGAAYLSCEGVGGWRVAQMGLVRCSRWSACDLVGDEEPDLNTEASGMSISLPVFGQRVKSDPAILGNLSIDT